ncbi:MAG: Phosphocarrier HPr protein of PTS system [Candidatus Ozemobacter sibiricus]|uniref:Phosphocarrier HPr protein of PTS system n=1 Tax=Candidatus Ozemobacter sibiricus TaxID=2268124 RepID=A0A367ZTP0_9BACT|nr:MAG: Phosphocarrier HPr protein of PTS system [Candidatus Ozemobacter sibiricus]
MKRKEVPITNKFGLHARPAALLVKLASTFESDVQLAKEDTEVNAKSILGVMMLAAGPGNVVTIIAEGKDEEAAVQAISNLIESRFGEEEA